MQSALRQTCRSRSIMFSRRAALPSSSLRARPSFRTVVTKRYTVEHETVSYDDATGLGTVSITNHAQEALGDVVFVELPVVGTKIDKGDQIGAVESVKAASDIYAPVSGTVESVNENLANEPGLLNRSPEDKGWLCTIKLSDPAEVESLLTEEAYKASYE